MSDTSQPEDSAGLFIDQIVRRTRVGTIKGILRMLEKGPPGRSQRPADLARHDWFRSLSDDDKEKVVEVVREAVDHALFSTMVLLDGATSGWPVQGRYSDFALYLQVYNDEESYLENAPSSRERINRPANAEDLHDRFMNAAEDADRGGH
jgi:hypothetical protein